MCLNFKNQIIILTRFMQGKIFEFGTNTHLLFRRFAAACITKGRDPWIKRHRGTVPKMFLKEGVSSLWIFWTRTLSIDCLKPWKNKNIIKSFFSNLTEKFHKLTVQASFISYIFSTNKAIFKIRNINVTNEIDNKIADFKMIVKLTWCPGACWQNYIKKKRKKKVN